MGFRDNNNNNSGGAYIGLMKANSQGHYEMEQKIVKWFIENKGNAELIESKTIENDSVKRGFYTIRIKNSKKSFPDFDDYFLVHFPPTHAEAKLLAQQYNGELLNTPYMYSVYIKYTIAINSGGFDTNKNRYLSNQEIYDQE